MKMPYLHVQGGLDKNTVYCTLKTLDEVREHFAKWVEDMPFKLPESFSKLEVWTAGDDSWHVWQWGDVGEGRNQGFFVDMFDFDDESSGWKVLVDDVEVFSSWQDGGDDEEEDDEESDA